MRFNSLWSCGDVALWPISDIGWSKLRNGNGRVAITPA
jgi:hypothetical protein